MYRWECCVGCMVQQVVGRSRVSELRGEKIVEFIAECEMHVLNVPSEEYTYSGPTGESDIDVRIMINE